ncbi:MAG: tyrosine-type recombinase/integrase [Nevskia sp.]|nr:tyrosine-type recombinase/integrase [Nevskia sp.]
MKKLTDLTIRALQPRDADYFLRDPSAPGFGVRVRLSGRKSFEFVYDFHGRRRRLVYGEYDPKAGLDLTGARKLHAAAAKLLAEGDDPAATKQRKRETAIRAHSESVRHPTVRDLAALYMEHHARAKKRSWREDQRILDADVLPAWGSRKARDITRAEVNRLLDGIKSRGAGVMANRTLALVRKLFNFAIARDLMNNQANPAALVERRAVEAPRERVLSDEEIREAWCGLDTAPMARHTALALKLILVTGQRPGEVAGLEWPEIEGQWWTIPAAKSKNKLAHRVYLPALAQGVLAELKTLALSERWVFPGARDAAKSLTVVALSHAVRDWLNQRGVEDRWTPHDLRRSCATNMGRLGVTRFVQDKVLNHKDRSIGATYDLHEYDREKRQALERWGAALSELLTGKQQGKVVAFPHKPAH